MSTELYRKCSKCGAIPIQDESISFHRFPKPGKTNILRARAWAIYCWPEKDWTSVESLTQLYTKHKMLCARHFEDSCFTDSSKKRLGKFSVPGSCDFATDLMSSLRADRFENTTTEIVSNVSPVTQHQSVAGSSALHASTSRATIQHTISYNKGVSVPAIQHQQTAGPSGLHRPAIVQSAIVQPVISDHEGVSVPAIQHQQTAGPSGLHRPAIVQSSIVQPAISDHEKLPTTKCKGILKSLDINKVSQLNDKERKLYLLARKNIKEINRLRKELRRRKQMSKIENIFEDNNIKNLFNLNLSPSFVILLQSQLRNCPRKQKGRRYTLNEKIMALSLFKRSPVCYRLLRRLFTLPSQSTLNKLLNRVPFRAGINTHVFDALEGMVKLHRECENSYTLLFDEMSIRKHLVYNQRFDIIEGFQDHGDHGRSEQVATNVLVFMLCGIRKRWKQPVAFYFSGKSVTADRLAVLIKNVLDQCFRIKLNVVSTVCDLSRVNLKALKILGSTTDAPYFKHQEKEIVTVLDPPHLLKCLRNLFMKYDVECQIDVRSDSNVIKGIAKWDHIKTFYECEKKHGNFVYMPALTEAHIYPNSKQKMRVKLAAQVISYSMTAGLNARIVGQELPSEAIATMTFIEKFDKLFDCLNADSADLRRGKIHSTNMTKSSPHLKFFSEMKLFINNMKFINCKTPPPSQSGWIQTINAVTRLWHNLQKNGIQSLSTRRLNQDPLENFFGCIRYNCGSNDNPTVGQFIAGIKTAIISNLKYNSSRKNCEDDAGILYDNFKMFLAAEIEKVNNEPTVEEKDNSNNTEELLADVTESIELSTPQAQACAYVCGFIVRKLTIKDCYQCQNIFLASDIEPIHIFTSCREYNTMHTSLNYVSKNMVHCVEFCATIINNYLKTDAWGLNIKERGLMALEVVDFSFLRPCQEHFESNLHIIKESVFYICVKHFCLKQNKTFKEEEDDKKLKKKINILKNK